jgi:arylsulfatase A-like enzyme
LKPAVVFTWMTEPDHIQHGLGPGAPESLAAIRNDDRELALVLQKLEALGLREKTNIMVVSDHGFAQTVFNVNLSRALIDAGLSPAADSDDIVIATSGQAVALHVKDQSRIAAVVRFLQQQAWCGVVFTAAKKSGAPHEGSVAGTFSLEYAHLGGHARSPDIVFTFPWTSAPNRFGVRGTETAMVSGSRATGPYDGTGAGHGGIGPWTVRNTMLAWGPGFKRGAVVRTPTANVDVAPTVLHLLGQANAASAMDGRVIVEALANGPDEEQVAAETRTWRVQNGSYSAVLQTTETGGKRYIDKGWRER